MCECIEVLFDVEASVILFGDFITLASSEILTISLLIILKLKTHLAIVLLSLLICC